MYLLNAILLSKYCSRSFVRYQKKKKGQNMDLSLKFLQFKDMWIFTRYKISEER